MSMDFTAQLQPDPTERRRLQNRIAQRKFRQRKQQAQQTTDAQNTIYPTPSAPTGEQCISGTSSPRYSLHVPQYDTLPPLLNTPRSDEDNLEFDFDIDTIKQWLCDANSNSSSSSSLSLNDSYFTTHWPSTGSADTLQRWLHCSNDTHQAPHFPIERSTPRPDTAAAATAPSSAPSSAPQSTAPSSPINKGWLSAVHIAAQKGHDRIVSILLQQNNIDPNSTDSDGRTPLFHAAVEDHVPVLRVLLSHGAHVGRMDTEGRSVLHWAVLYRRLEILQVLLEHWQDHEKDWFNINAYDNVGWTPLHLAVDRGFEEGVLLLLQFGADINAKAKRCHETGKPIPFHIAQQMG